ncbi:hypothetical protein ACO0K9_01050 [Undibacterium sp. Ji50W]|uniref:hypothetical protein n=1 Tax=Undibacterium sp. Ji50W TaxID=3413041 RepID=UPI003BF13E65
MSDSKTCPGCGKKQSKQYSLLSLIILGVVCFGIYKVYDVAVSPAGGAQSQQPANLAWQYSSYKDKMSGKDVQVAEVNAEEEMQFAFPYAGKNRPSLTVRKSANGTYDVMIEIEKGQFVCMPECTLPVKYDQGEIVKVKAVLPSDGSSTALFFKSSPAMLQSLKSSKKIMIQATFYQEGTHALTFNTANLRLK